MLILTRRVGETFSVGDDIKIIITKIQGDQVKIGIEAPENVFIAREEFILDKEFIYNPKS